MAASYNHHWSIFKAWKDWKAACLSSANLDVCSENELKRRAHYLGIPVAQLRWVLSYRPDPISLLERRMEALSLDPDEVAHLEPLMLRELRHRCAQCAKREQCALDLADKSADSGWQSWRDYCPNAATLTTLSTFKSCSPITEDLRQVRLASAFRPPIDLSPSNDHWSTACCENHQRRSEP